MATPKAHIYRVPKTHPVASKMKAGEEMTARMKMMPRDDEAAEDEDYQMEESEAAPYAAPVVPAVKKKKTPAEVVKAKRQMPT